MSALGKVPSAAAADSATNATNASNAVHAGAAAALDHVTYKTAAGSVPAGTQTSDGLGRVGNAGGADVPFTVYAVCTSVTAAS